MRGIRIVVGAVALAAVAGALLWHWSVWIALAGVGLSVAVEWIAEPRRTRDERSSTRRQP